MTEEIIGKPTKVNERGVITIPKEVREILKITDGEDSVYFKIINNRITINKAIVKYEYIDELIKKSNQA